jgi:Spy/CpxP family protein refolding chaperone
MKKFVLASLLVLFSASAFATPAFAASHHHHHQKHHKVHNGTPNHKPA